MSHSITANRRRFALQLCKRLLDCHSMVEELLSSGSELSLVHSRRLMERHMNRMIDRIVSLPNSKAEVCIRFNFDPKVGVGHFSLEALRRATFRSYISHIAIVFRSLTR